MAQFFAIHPTHPQVRLVRRAAEIVRWGGLVAYPTDSCYALGCLPASTKAIERLRRIRGVDERHHLTLMCRDLAEVAKVARLRGFTVVPATLPRDESAGCGELLHPLQPHRSTAPGPERRRTSGPARISLVVTRRSVHRHTPRQAVGEDVVGRQGHEHAVVIGIDGDRVRAP